MHAVLLQLGSYDNYILGIPYRSRACALRNYSASNLLCTATLCYSNVTRPSPRVRVWASETTQRREGLLLCLEFCACACPLGSSLTVWRWTSDVGVFTDLCTAFLWLPSATSPPSPSNQHFKQGNNVGTHLVLTQNAINSCKIIQMYM